MTTGLLVSGRVGAGIGAKIGAMNVTEQIDALEANAVDAFKYLAVTRFIACMIAMPLLTKKVNETIDLLTGDVQDAIQSIGDTVDSANQLITDVTDDVKTMASAGARITGDAAEIADTIRNGKGTIGKLVNDDELYKHAATIAKQTEQIATAPGAWWRMRVRRSLEPAVEERADSERRVESETNARRSARGDGGLRREHGRAQTQLSPARLLQPARIL